MSVPDEVDVNDALRRLARYSRIAVAFAVVGAVLAAIPALTAPVRYRATATFVVFPSAPPVREMALDLGRSRRAAVATGRAVAALREVPADGPEERIPVLSIGVSRGGVLEAIAEDPRPDLAAALANAYVDEVRKLLQRYSNTDVGRQRQFLTEQLETVRGRALAAREALDRLRGDEGGQVLDERRRRQIDAEAAVHAEIIASELQLQVLRVFAPMALADQVGFALRIEELKRGLGATRPREGAPPAAKAAPAAEGPNRQLVTLIREARVQETLAGLIEQQIDRARINELRDAPTLEVIDPAIPPGAPESRRLAWRIGSGAVLGLLAGVALGLLRDAARRRPVL
jgi:uncharacterized protein involved in exopolysaccharide biosynthesis